MVVIEWIQSNLCFRKLFLLPWGGEDEMKKKKTETREVR